VEHGVCYPQKNVDNKNQEGISDQWVAIDSRPKNKKQDGEKVECENSESCHPVGIPGKPSNESERHHHGHAPDDKFRAGDQKVEEPG